MSILNRTLPAGPLLLSTRYPSRRRIDRETTPGHCRNLDYCSIGKQRALIRVPISQGFVCPECARPLSAPQSRLRLSSAALPALRLAVLLAGMTATFGLGYGVARVQPVVSHAVSHASRTAMEAAHTLMQPPALPQPPLSQPVLVAERPYPSKAGPVELAAPPARLLHEARFGQVTIDCVLAARKPRPTCQVADVRGADAFSADSVLWLQNRAVRYLPSSRSGEDHRWRVVFQDFGGTQRRDTP